MWLPTPIYERVPQFWLLLGLLFISSGVYLGFDYRLSFAYLVVGVVCVAWSLTVFLRRYHHRNDPARKPIPTFVSDVENAKDSEQPENPVSPAG